MKDFWPVILITFVGFFALAAMLLIPVWRFLSREEEAGEAFTQAVEDDLSGDAADPEPASNPELASNLEPASNLETASNPDVDQDRVGSAGLSCSKVFSPIPRTSSNSSIEEKDPFAVRN